MMTNNTFIIAREGWKYLGILLGLLILFMLFDVELLEFLLFGRLRVLRSLDRSNLTRSFEISDGEKSATVALAQKAEHECLNCSNYIPFCCWGTRIDPSKSIS